MVKKGKALGNQNGKKGRAKGKGKSKGQKASIHQRVLDLSLSSKSHEIKKAKTHKGRKIQESKEAKIVENPKTAMFIKGLKSSKHFKPNSINNVFRSCHKYYPERAFTA